MICIGKLKANISYDCTPANRAIGGLEGSALLINRSEIDWTSVTQSGITVTNLSLVSGATAYSIEWVKQLSVIGSEVSINDGLDTFMQSFGGRIFGSGADDGERMKELLEGEYVVIVPTKFKGTSQTATYKILGLETGLKMKEGAYSSAENDGALTFTLASVENYGESYPFLVWLESNYTTTKAKFDNLLSA